MGNIVYALLTALSPLMRSWVVMRGARARTLYGVDACGISSPLSYVLACARQTRSFVSENDVQSRTFDSLGGARTFATPDV